ncbi:uncharacterized protein TNCV_4939511 [Trichonephila clavipes]|nr:uncharacterized protein TNCV_4939511 [Trichonephila clavipes]
MEMGLLQAMLDVSMCLVCCSAYFGIIINPEKGKHLCVQEDPVPVDHERYNTCRRPFSALSARRRRTTYRAAARCRPLSSIRKKNLCYYGAKSFTMVGASVCKKTSCVRSPSTDDSEGTAYARQENMFLGRSNNGFFVQTDESRFTMESDSGRLLIWKQRTRYHQSNTVERHSYRGGGIPVPKISLRVPH